MKTLSVFYKGMLFSLIIAALYREIFVSGAIVGGAFLYFTVQSNILVALCLLTFVFKPTNERSLCIIRGVSLLAITLTGLAYNFLLYKILRDWGTPAYTYSRMVTHVLAPVGFTVDWLLFDKHGMMKFKDVLIWLAYPAVYYSALLYASYRYGFSIYFFVNYASGNRSVLLWLGAFSGALIIISLLFVGADKLVDGLFESIWTKKPKIKKLLKTLFVIISFTFLLKAIATHLDNQFQHFLGAFFILFPIIDCVKFLNIYANGVTTEATVLRTEKEYLDYGDGPSYSYRPVLSYTVEGKCYEVKYSTGNMKPKYVDGAYVQIMYHKDKPDKIWVLYDRTRLIINCIFLIVGTILLLIPL